MTQGTRKLLVALITGMAALALGAGAVRPAPARAASPAPGTYVALGDSYSAGAGAPPYRHDSPYPSDTDGCDRSASAWPETLGSDLGFSGPQFSFHACTGSVVKDLTRTNPATREPPQESWSTADTRLVTLTDGGNDVGFVPVLIACVLNWSCPIADGSILDSNIAGIESSLVTAYKGIASSAPGATIIVMGYPRFFPSSPPAVCYTGILDRTFIGAQMSWMNGEVQKLDTQIQAAVTAAQQAGDNVLYVTGSYDAFAGHELCTADPYMNDAVPTNPFSLSNPVQTESFHPNLAGNQQMANLALTTYRTTYTRVPNVVGLPATNAVSAIRSAGLVPVEVSSVDTTCNNIGYVINQSSPAGVLVAAGSPVTITVAVKPPNPCP